MSPPKLSSPATLHINTEFSDAKDNDSDSDRDDQLSALLRQPVRSSELLASLRGVVLPPLADFASELPFDVTVLNHVIKPLQAQVELIDRAGAALFLRGSVGLLSKLEDIRTWLLVSDSVLEADGACMEERFSVASALPSPVVESWPLCEVITPRCMKGYARVRQFLLQLLRVRYLLQNRWVDVKAVWTREEHPLTINRRVLVTTFDMSHFVRTIESYVHWQVRVGVGPRLHSL